MTKTHNLGLPLVAPAQAQKHVTVNEALARLDALVNARVISSGLSTPPLVADDGACYIVPADASGQWNFPVNHIVVRSNGGWVNVEPKLGWSVWNEELSCRMTFNGRIWISDAVAVSSRGAATISRILEFEHFFYPGIINYTLSLIPAGSQVLSVNGTVATEVVGNNISSLRIGVDNFEDRYGDNIGLTAGSYFYGLTGYPVSYYEDTPILITTNGDYIMEGSIIISIHLNIFKRPNED